jgi:hypothetical protein
MSRGQEPLTIGFGVNEFTPEFFAAPIQRTQARDCTQDLQENPGEFAVEIERLSARGATTSALRWLVQQGPIEHAREVALQGDAAGRFQPARNLGFTKATCFLIPYPLGQQYPAGQQHPAGQY